MSVGSISRKGAQTDATMRIATIVNVLINVVSNYLCNQVEYLHHAGGEQASNAVDGLHVKYFDKAPAAV